jgi:hypothetical protein
VTVGSVASDGAPNSEYQVAVAGPGAPSPFTRVGPGPGRTRDGARKPEFVALGGNWSYEHSAGRVSDRSPSMNVISAIVPQGARQLGVFSGTSFAAPRVASAIADIATRYPDASANLLRALAAVGAQRDSSLNVVPDGSRPLDVGVYGSINVVRSCESAGPRVVLMHDGQIEADTVEIHRLPIPRRFLEGYSSRSIRIALAFDPPVRRQRREYIAGSMHFDLVRGSSLDEIDASYRRQPTRKEVKESGAVRYDLPAGRMQLLPTVSRFASNTLICRSFEARTGWDDEVLDYFVVVTHQRSSWSESQKKRYKEQRYALAVELYDQARLDLNLYALVRARLRGQLRIRTR